MEEWEATIAHLRTQYLVSALERLDTIERSLDVLDRNPSDTEALRAMARAYHKLAGSGGTYGFPKISELGFRGEVECTHLAERGSAPNENVLRLLRSILSELKVEFGRQPPADTEC